MSYLLFVFLLVLVAPLLIATWRVSLAGLALQGLLMAAMVAERGWPRDASAVVLVLDLLVVRAWFVPFLLHRILTRQRAPRRSDVIPANLLSWTLAGGLIVLAFQFADALEPAGGEAALHLAVATSGLLLGLLVLATQTGTLGQVVGALRIENSIALFALGGREQPLPVQLGTSAALVLSVLVFGAFLRRSAGERLPVAAAAPGEVDPS